MIHVNELFRFETPTGGGDLGSNQLGWDFSSYKAGGFYWYKNLLNLIFVCDI